MARGFIGFQIADQRKDRKAAQREAYQATLLKDRESAIATAMEFATIAEQAAKTGQMTPEQFEQFQVGALQALQRHATTLDMNRKLAVETLEREGRRRPRRARELAARLNELPSGEAFINEQLPMLEARFQSAMTMQPEDPVAAGQQAAEQEIARMETILGRPLTEAERMRVADIEPEVQVKTLTPEEVTQFGFPEGSIVQQKPDGTLSLAFSPSENMSSLQERVAALLATGVDEQRALGIAAGRYQVSVNPLTNERQVFDVATGERVGDELPERRPEDVPSMIPEGIDAQLATGAPGAFRNVVNIVGDAFGAGTAFPQAKEATEALRSLQLFTTTTMQSEVPGRPSNFLLERLEALTVQPNSLLQGEEGAKTRLQQTQRLINGEISRLENDVLPMELPPDVRVETELNLTQLKRLNAAYEDLITSFESGSEVSPELQAILDKYPDEEEPERHKAK
jgi:hypothetical protein